MNAALVMAGVFALLGDVNVAGSIYLNNPTLFSERADALGATVRGMNAETSFKLVADVTDHVSVSAKVCFGCHGFTADMAYVDWQVKEQFNIRAGRFPVPFGEFYLRHDPANHKAASKPLPYEMGRMLRRDQYNLTILPEPYPDNGIELYGTFRGDVAELAYNLYAVAGLKGNAATGDLDFIQSRLEYYVDNNRQPSVGGRMTLSFPRLPARMWRWVSLGASAMYGHYDPDATLFYFLAGVDFYTRIDRINLRAEVMMRRTAIPDDPLSYRQVLVDLWVQREGFYVQVDAPITSYLEWLIRVDGFKRSGPLNVNSELTSTDSSILRYTAGINVIPTNAIKLKLNYELWNFSEFPTEHVIHTGLVGTY